MAHDELDDFPDQWPILMGRIAKCLETAAKNPGVDLSKPRPGEPEWGCLVREREGDGFTMTEVAVPRNMLPMFRKSNGNKLMILVNGPDKYPVEEIVRVVTESAEKCAHPYAYVGRVRGRPELVGMAMCTEKVELITDQYAKKGLAHVQDDDDG